MAEVIAHMNARDNMVKNKAPGVMRECSPTKPIFSWAAKKFA